MSEYRILTTEGRAKRAEFHTVHGVIQTPVFMNVGTVAAIKGAVSTEDLEGIGTQVELSNTYHLHVRPGDEVVKKLGGLHKFMSWNKPILTDSGGFQVFSLATLRKIKEEGVYFRSHVDGRKIFMGPEESMQIQSNLASTIAKAFVVPYLPQDKPTYLMGVGTPANILEGVERGIDFFDCVYPSRNGRHGHVYTNHGKLNLLNAKYELEDRPIQEGCGCPACRRYSRAYLRHLLKAKEMLGMRLCVLHNLYFYNHLMEEIRDALDQGRFAAYKKEKLAGFETKEA